MYRGRFSGLLVFVIAFSSKSTIWFRFVSFLVQLKNFGAFCICFEFFFYYWTGKKSFVWHFFRWTFEFRFLLIKVKNVFLPESNIIRNAINYLKPQFNWHFKLKKLNKNLTILSPQRSTKQRKHRKKKNQNL